MMPARAQLSRATTHIDPLWPWLHLKVRDCNLVFKSMIALLQVRTDQANKIFCQFSGGHGTFFVAQHVQTNVVFEDLSHEAVDPSTHVRKEHQDVCAIVVRCQRTFDSVNLPTNPPYASYQLLLFFFKMRHFFLAYMLGGYAIRIGSRLPKKLNGEL
jgi:hypothetical protein